jgi:hypothetical protein
MSQGINNLFLVQFGQRGSRWLSATASTVTGNFKAIHIISNTEFADLDDSYRSTESDSLTGFIIPTGAMLGGKFTKIRLASGKVILYI